MDLPTRWGKGQALGLGLGLGPDWGSLLGAALCCLHGRLHALRHTLVRHALCGLDAIGTTS